MERQAGLSPRRGGLRYRPGQRLEVPLPLLQKWRRSVRVKMLPNNIWFLRSIFGALHPLPDFCWSPDVYVGGLHRTVPQCWRTWNLLYFPDIQGRIFMKVVSQLTLTSAPGCWLRCCGDGLLAQCLLHRGPLLGPLLLLLILDLRLDFYLYFR